MDVVGRPFIHPFWWEFQYPGDWQNTLSLKIEEDDDNSQRRWNR
jgi:hypothetical protein